MQKIVVLNPKGGSGKSTIATNLASYFAVSGMKPALMDMDSQGSSMRWLRKRGDDQLRIHGIAGFERNMRVTRSFATRVPVESERLIVDTAAALDRQTLPEVTRNATAILVPVLPSDIDIHAATRCISDLLLVAKIRRDEQRIAVIANRVKMNTLIYKSLLRFLETLQIPVIATLRDSQNYIRAAETGVGLFEMSAVTVREDLEQWLPLVGWIAQRQPLTLIAGAPAISSTLAPKPAVAPVANAQPAAPAAAPVIASTPSAAVARLDPLVAMPASLVSSAG
jgi:chromosome partitioning protein